jgi:hypothetical protein
MYKMEKEKNKISRIASGTPSLHNWQKESPLCVSVSPRLCVKKKFKSINYNLVKKF